MSKHGEIYDSVEKIVAKLYILKNSCAGVLNSEKSTVAEKVQEESPVEETESEEGEEGPKDK